MKETIMLSDVEIRLRCIELAISVPRLSGALAADPLANARAFYEFVVAIPGAVKATPRRKKPEIADEIPF